MPIPVKSVLTAYTDVEKQLQAFFDRVPFVPEHDKVWSPALASCLLEACSQLDSFWKASAVQPQPKKIDIGDQPQPKKNKIYMDDHFKNFSSSVAAGRWLVIWGDEGRELQPFALWNSAGTLTKADYKPTDWWQAYNDIKHDRWANIRQATLENAANAVAGLFLAIVRSTECFDALVEAGWFRSDCAASYVIDKLSQEPESPHWGMTMESSLFSYAASSCDAEFVGRLRNYHKCTHRFGRWLEEKFHRSVVSY